MIKKLLCLLVLLMTATTGAWAVSYRLYLDVSGTSATLKYGSYDGKPSYISGGWDAIGDVKTTVQTITTDATSCANFSGTTLNSLFYEFTALTSVDLSGLNTANVTNMASMFGSCTSLTSVDLSGLNTSKVTNMGTLFIGCSSLTSVDLSSWDTSSATNMGSMFYGCSALTSVNLSSFNTSNVTIMGGMFNSCSSLTTLDLSSFNTSKVTAMPTMFEGCTNLATIYVGNDWSTDAVTSSNNMFRFCTKLLNLNSNHATDKTNAHTGEGGYLSTKPYKVTLAEGTEDAKNWTIPAEAAEGTTVTVTYKGDKKVKSVKAKKKTAAGIVNPVVGQIIGSDGKNYDANATLPDGVTAVAKICYVGDDAETSPSNTTFKNGLALALEDVSVTNTWCSHTDATCLGTQYDDNTKFNDLAGIDNTDALVNHTGHTHAAASAARGYNSGTHPAGTSAWFLPSAGQWQKMIVAAGLSNLGLQKNALYWSSTEEDLNGAWGLVFDDIPIFPMEAKTVDHKVRACLAF